MPSISAYLLNIPIISDSSRLQYFHRGAGDDVTDIRRNIRDLGVHVGPGLAITLFSSGTDTGVRWTEHSAVLLPRAIYSIASAIFISPLRSSFTTEDRSILFFEAIFSTKYDTNQDCLRDESGGIRSLQAVLSVPAVSCHLEICSPANIRDRSACQLLINIEEIVPQFLLCFAL